MELIESRTALPALVLPCDDVLRNLERYAHYARGAMAPNTERAYHLASGIFTAWCSERGLQALPASVETIVAFVDDQATRYKPATVAARVSHISAMHEAARWNHGSDDEPLWSNPCRAPAVALAKKRMYREKGRRQRQVTGITFEARQKMLDAAPQTLQGARNRALLTLAYDAGMRRSELVALQVEDLSFDEDGTGAVLLRKSKTDQEGEGQLRFLAADTVRYVRAWLDGANITTGPLFRRVTRWGTPGGKPLYDGAAYDIFRDMAAAADLPDGVADGIGAHSTRVGMAQGMAAAGCTMAEIMQAGGWKTATMVARYTERLDVKKSGAAKLARMQGRM